MKLQIKVLVALALGASVSSTAFAQKKAPENWFNLDKTKDGVQGVSTEETYQTLLKGKKGQTVVVAVIDGGVDYNHEDLKDIMWRNPREIPGNGIDDDKNGYVDDVYGWNFIGGKDGKNVHHETLEMTRVYAKLRKAYGKMSEVDAAKLGKKEKAEYEKFKELGKKIEEERKEAAEGLQEMEATKTMVMNGLAAIEKALDGKPLTKEQVEKIEAKDQTLQVGKGYLLKSVFGRGEKPKDMAEARSHFEEQIQEGFDYYNSKANFQYNPDYDSRTEIVKDNYEDSNERYYGNNDVKGPDAFHGTHVAGIIAAIRKNGKGMDGVADNVRIMAVRCVPDGDERDKDVANAIRYAVDNGATVINMSFGKSYSWDKEAVDAAVKYAASKDVLLVHAAGNDSKDNDAGHNNFPTARFERAGWFRPKKAKNWIEVGALSWKTGENTPANFTNYGQQNVDVFAPGVDIYSTAPDGKYKNASGTSMASPVTAGVAALVRSYYPELSAEQVKAVIEGSVVPLSETVKKPGTSEKVPFATLSRTGGVVNAYKAIQAASQVKGTRKVKPKA